jgi:hypothetical protein
MKEGEVDLQRTDNRDSARIAAEIMDELENIGATVVQGAQVPVAVGVAFFWIDFLDRLASDVCVPKYIAAFQGRQRLQLSFEPGECTCARPGITLCS